ncbi:calcium/proton exchanger [Cryptococcus wingfieldii CBS 7118]|uniref:Calcium/proton exchanger n=1 Tax=Cryptococcus wingfieldii CBS 7118 TaxID=1295528 RepID=A0A1E3JPC5_9TREE|nr:calcium/proton exchanger [Cryptococcus wingfieldii CBS 7118]ODO01987.1 calcium/proton exchanger [Cryptococcus wingfieldii CBS 7118]
MVHSSVVDPEPEPDIEGHNPQPTTTQPDSTAAAPNLDTNDVQQQEPDNVSAPTKQPYGLRTILKPRSRPGHQRKPSIIINEPEPIEPRDATGPMRSNSAPTIAGLRPQDAPGPGLTRNRLAPLRNISIPLPPKMGPPQGEQEKVKRKFIEPTWKECFVNTIKYQPLLVAVPIILPISWALHFSHQNPIAIFVTSLLTIVPLAGGLSFATEELAHRVGEAWGGLLNASFGNAVELIIAILALVKGQIDIVQASMIGSILSNVLLVLGMSYFVGGMRFHEQMYAIIGAQMHISLLGISLMAIVLPAAYHYAYPSTSSVVSDARSGTQPEGEELENLLTMSRGLSFILLAVYAMFLVFQLYTHAYLFRVPVEKVQHPLPGPVPHHERVFPRPHWVDSIVDSSSSSSSSSSGSSIRSGRSHRRFKKFRRFSVGKKENRETSGGEGDGHEADSEHDASANATAIGEMQEKATVSPVSPITPVRTPSNHSGSLHPPPNPNIDIERQSMSSNSSIFVDDDGTVHVQPKIKFWYAMGMLLFMTALAGVTAEWLVDSIDGLTETGNVSREFVGLILLPVIGNSVEHFAAVIVSWRDKLNLALSIAVGSSIQVSLCLLPILVLLGWAIDQPMLLFFDPFETITLVISIILVNFAISDGRTNYLEGFVMMMAYISIALVCW